MFGATEVEHSLLLFSSTPGKIGGQSNSGWPRPGRELAPGPAAQFPLEFTGLLTLCTALLLLLQGLLEASVQGLASEGGDGCQHGALEARQGVVGKHVGSVQRYR